MPSQGDTQRLRTAQAGVRRLVEQDLAAFFATLDLGKPEKARGELLAFLPALVQTYGQIAATVAADWYDTVRADENIPGRFRALTVIPDETAAIDATVRRAAGDLFTDNPQAALLSLTGPAGKYALAGGRASIIRSSVADPQASGWSRATRSGSCAFCRMLAGRGAVYRRDSVDFASHAHCNCAAVPSWDADAPEVDVRAYEASMRTSLMSPGALATHRANVRRWLADFT